MFQRDHPKRPESSARNQILAAATRLFAERGFDGTSLQALGDEVGIRKPSLLYHFPSKDALRHQVVEEILSHWGKTLPGLLKAATNGEGRFDAVVQAVITFFTDDVHRARVLLREMLDRPTAMQDRLKGHLGPWLSLTTYYIRVGQREGSVHQDLDPEAYILQILHLIVASVAMRDVAGSVLRDGESPSAKDSAEEEEPAATRQLRELVRLAKAGLFVTPQPPEGADHG